MAASGLQFNHHRQTAETLPILTSDYTTDRVNYRQLLTIYLPHVSDGVNSKLE